MKVVNSSGGIFDNLADLAAGISAGFDDKREKALFQVSFNHM
jgi:hypothetical protein